MSRQNKRRVDAASVPGETPLLIPPYHAEEITFGMAFGNITESAKITDYINKFASENDAALLQMIPTQPGSYLFVWDKT